MTGRIPILKILLSILLLSSFYTLSKAQTSMQMFKLNQVQLQKSPFLSAEQVDLDYMLKLDPDRLLAPFLRETGLSPKAASYGNWENTGLDGHTGGHYLTALAQMYAAAGSAECKKRLDYMVSELAICQAKNKNGYVGGVPGGNAMWAKVKTGDFSEYNKRWVPWYNLHKLYAGLRDCYLLAGNEQAKTVFLALSDWADQETAGLSDQQIQNMLNTEHGGMNEVFADAYALTGNQKYLKLAEKFSHHQLLEPLARHEDKLTGLHANTQIPKVIGFQRIAELNKDTTYTSAARFFWQTVVNHRSTSIGGNSVREHFNPADNFASMLESEEGPETCNSNNMLKLSKMLFLDEGKATYLDFYERLLYNHILSSQHPDKGGFVYFTPIHPQHYRVYSTADESFWCCVGTGMENHGKYGELIYTHKNDNVYVNLFIPSTLDFKEKGIKLSQQNKFPDQESTSLSIDAAAGKRFTLFIRKPYWVKEGAFVLNLNGKAATHLLKAGQYVGISRIWKKGDKITVSLPMKTYEERLPDHSAWVSFIHGPIVLAAPTDTTKMPGLFANDSRWGHIAGGPLYPLAKSPLLIEGNGNPANQLQKLAGQDMEFSMTSLIEQPEYKKLKLIPFYRVQDTRYMLYWPVTSKDSAALKVKELTALDETFLKLAPRTVDLIAFGEQQSENDHKLQAENSETGLKHNIHWRSASGQLKFQMRNSASAKFLRISYYAKDKNRSFDVLVNNVKLAHIDLDGSGADEFVSAAYPLPASVSGPLQIALAATDNQQTASIAEVRVLR